MSLSRFVTGMLWVGLMVLGVGMVFGQDYPNKPIRIVVSAPGGGSDFMARLIGQAISGPLGQPVVPDYRGSGILSADYVAKLPPDGYALFISGSVLWIYPLLRKAPYDAVRDFSPVTMVSTVPSILAVHPSVPAKSVKELIALAKARPGELNYGSGSGYGSTTHLAGELFNALAGVKIVHVPYKGNAAAVTALLSGELQMLILEGGLIAPHVRSGRLRALAVTSPEPSVLVPGLPTVAASGLPGYEVLGITGIWVPAKTPAVIINRLNQEIVRVLNQPDVKQKFFDFGEEVVASTPEQLAAKMKSEIARLSKVIKDADIKGE